MGEFNMPGMAVIFLALGCNLYWGLMIKGFGVLLPTLQDQFTTHTWIIGIMVSLMTVVADFTGLLSSPLDAKFGSGPVAIYCTVTVALALMLIPFATSVIHIALAFTLLIGPGMGVLTILNKSLLGRHFTKHYSLACGIAHCGQGMAILAFAPMIQLFLDVYGWRGAVLLMAGICSHPIASAALIYTTRRPKYQPVPDRDETSPDDDEDVISTKASCIRLLKYFDVHMLKDFNFWIIFACQIGVISSNVCWMVYFVPHLEAKGITAQVAANLSIAAAVGLSVGAFLWSPLIDGGLVKCSSAILISSLTLGLSFVVDPWVSDTVSVAIVTFIFGLSLSAMFTLLDVFTKDLLGCYRLTSAFGWSRGLTSLVRLFAGFFPGWIYDNTGSYDVAFISVGIVQVVTLIPLIIGLIRKTV